MGLLQRHDGTPRVHGMELPRAVRPQELAAACMDLIALEGGAGVALGAVFERVDPANDRQLRTQAWHLLRKQRRVLRFYYERRVAVKSEAPAGDSPQSGRSGKKRKRPADRAADAADQWKPSLAAVKSEAVDALSAPAAAIAGGITHEGGVALHQETENTEQPGGGSTTGLEREPIPDAVVETMPYDGLVGGEAAAAAAAAGTATGTATVTTADDAGAAAERVVVVACDELRHRALNIPVKAIVADLGDDHFRILEAVGRAREAGVTITDLARLGQDHAIKKMHNSLDTLISYGLVVKRMLIVSRPAMRRMNIVHLPRFADAFLPTMFDESAEFESDEQSKKILAGAAEAYLKTLPNQSSVLTDLGRDLNLQKRHLELLRSHIIQESKRDENFPLELFQAVLQPSKRASLEPKILNCVRYRLQRDSNVSGNGPEHRRGIVVELGLLNQIYGLIEDSGSHGATIVEMRNQIVLPGSKLPYKLVSILAGTYGLRAETIILGKNKAFRLFVDADAMANSSKTVDKDASTASSVPAQQANGLPSDTGAAVEDDNSAKTSKPKETQKPDAVFSIRANKALKVALGGQEIDATLERRRNHLLERLEREKIISLSSLRASVFGMERAMGAGSAADRLGWENRVISSHFSSASMGAVGVVDTRSILRIANDLETERKLRLLQLPLPARNVSTKFRALRCVVLPGYEHNQRFIKNFVQNYCRDERLRRIHQNADKSQVVRIDSVGSDDNDLASDPGLASKDTNRQQPKTPAASTNTNAGAAADDKAASQSATGYSSFDETVENALIVNVNQAASGSARQAAPLEISYRIRRFVSQKKTGIHNQQYRKLGFAYGVMYRCKALHRFMWKFLHEGSDTHGAFQVNHVASIAQSSAVTAASHREGTDRSKSPARNRQDSPRPSKGIIFSREEVLHAMPIYLYIQVFSGGAILSASEFAVVEEAVEKKWSFGALTVTLREKIWSNESERTSKVLGTLADLELVVPYKIGMKNLAKILQAGYTDDRDGVLSQALKDNALGGLFRLNNHARIYLDDADGDYDPFASSNGARAQGTAPRSINDLESLKLVGVTEKAYSFTESIPLQFELKSADDIDRYWEALECLCLEQMVMEVPNPRRNEPAVCEIPKPVTTRARRMMRILAWIPKSQKLTPKKANADGKHSGIVSTVRRARKRKLSMMIGDNGAEEDSANEREHQVQQIALRKEKKSRQKAQARAVGNALTWTERDEHQLVELFIDNCKSRWRVPIPQGLQQGREEVAFRNHTVSRSGFGLVALARTLNKRTIDVKKRLKERLLEPVVKLRFEDAKHEAMVEHHRQSMSFDEEVAILGSTRMTALFRRAVMIIVSPVQEYHPLVAEELISHWTAPEIRTVWRYMWLKNWIVRATEKERGRGYSMSQRLQDSLKITTLSYPLVLFRQAAEQASVVTSALEEIPFENYDSERDAGGVDGQNTSISSADQVFDEEFPTNASPGRCALELVCQAIGTNSMTVQHTPFAEMEKKEEDEDEDEEGDDGPDEENDDGNGDVSPEGKDNDQLLSSKSFRGGLGFAAHLAKQVKSNKASVLLDSWHVETQMHGVSTDKDTLQELEAFSLESDEDNDGLGAVAFRPFKRRKKFQEALEKAVVRHVKASGEEGLTLSVLMEKLRSSAADGKDNAAVDGKPNGWYRELRSTSIARVGRCLNTLVDAGAVLCVNAYFEQRYIVKEHGDVWLLRPFSLMPSTGKKSTPRVLFEGEKDTLSFPWLKMDGSTNYRFLFAIQRKLLMFILQSPGISEDKVYVKMGRLLTLQDTREALSLLVEEGLVYTRAATAPRSPPSLFGAPPAHKTTRVVNLVGNVLTHDRSAFTVHYFPHVECIQRFGGIVQDHQGEAVAQCGARVGPPGTST